MFKCSIILIILCSVSCSKKEVNINNVETIRCAFKDNGLRYEDIFCNDKIHPYP